MLTHNFIEPSSTEVSGARGVPGRGDAGVQGGVPRGAPAGAPGQLPEELQEDRAEGALRQRRHPAAQGGVHHLGATGMQVRTIMPKIILLFQKGH